MAEVRIPAHCVNVELTGSQKSQFGYVAIQTPVPGELFGRLRIEIGSGQGGGVVSIQVDAREFIKAVRAYEALIGGEVDRGAGGA